MSIIVNSRISFVFALMKCSFAAFGEQNKIDNDSKCQQVYKSPKKCHINPKIDSQRIHNKKTATQSVAADRIDGVGRLFFPAIKDFRTIDIVLVLVVQRSP